MNKRKGLLKDPDSKSAYVTWISNELFDRALNFCAKEKISVNDFICASMEQALENVEPK